MTSAPLFLGVDGGGHKTVAAVVDGSGAVLGTGRGGCSNYQVTGIEAARSELQGAIREALQAAGLRVDDLTAAGLGIAGADHAPEMAIVRSYVSEIVPLDRCFVENDTLIVLRAGTLDGVGCGLVAGSGTNCIARDASGNRFQVGGMGALSGDRGNAIDLTVRACAAAWLGGDGRGPKTSLTAAIPRALGARAMEEVPAMLEGAGRLSGEHARVITDVLFWEANEGDAEAQRVLEEAGEALGNAAVRALEGLHLDGERAVVVMGGSMLQLREHGILRTAVERRIKRSIRSANVHRLEVDPVIGALLFASDRAGATTPNLVDALRAAFPR